MKHTNPCGLATAGDVAEAYKLALGADPTSAFGGVIGVNRQVDAELATEFVKTFKEGIIAPSFSEEALSILKKKKRVRLIEVGKMGMEPGEMDFTKIVGGMLIQSANDVYIDESKVRVVSDREPTKSEWTALRYGWKVIKHIKSNAIIFVNENMTVGIGAGQMSRVDAVKVAAMKADKNSPGCVMASDAFFPFRDGIDEAQKAGITAVIQPGGSIRDQEVLDAVNEYGMAMVYTGMRQFKH
jgi:phosphoribosylaminoimidazolecarboxamide formyltransferase/IMP cyclohydrolase